MCYNAAKTNLQLSKYENVGQHLMMINRYVMKVFIIVRICVLCEGFQVLYRFCNV